MNARHFIRRGALTLALLLATPALAQQPTPGAIAAAREVVELKGGVSMFEPIVGSIIEQTKGALLQTNPQLSKDLNDVGTALRTEFGPRSNEVLNEAAKFYAARFSEQELREIANFYKTAVGRKMLTAEPQALEETFAYVQQWGGRVSEDVMNRFRAEMKKKGHTL